MSELLRAEETFQKRRQEANPQMSDRAIAREIGVSHPTVARRQSTGNSLPVDDGPRIGLDGKVSQYLHLAAKTRPVTRFFDRSRNCLARPEFRNSRQVF
jgi:hypothetical protein